MSERIRFNRIKPLDVIHNGELLHAEVDAMENGDEFIVLQGGCNEVYLCSIGEIKDLRDWLNKVLP